MNEKTKLVLLRHVDAIRDRLLLAELIGQAVDSSSGDNPPPWVYVYCNQVESIREAAEELETFILRGYGAQPHGSEAKQPGRRSKVATSRVIGSPPGQSPSRHDKRSPDPQASNQVTGAVDIGTGSVHSFVKQ